MNSFTTLCQLKQKIFDCVDATTKLFFARLHSHRNSRIIFPIGTHCNHSIHGFPDFDILCYPLTQLLDYFKVCELGTRFELPCPVRMHHGKGRVISETQEKRLEEVGTNSGLQLLLSHLRGLQRWEARDYGICHCLRGSVIELQEVDLCKLEENKVNFGGTSVKSMAGLRCSLKATLCNWEVLEYLVLYKAELWPYQEFLVFDLKRLIKVWVSILVFYFSILNPCIFIVTHSFIDFAGVLQCIEPHMNMPLNDRVLSYLFIHKKRDYLPPGILAKEP